MGRRQDLPPGRELCPGPAGDGAGHRAPAPVTTAAQLADYGLDSPTKYVTVTDSQGASVTYRLGKESDGSVYVYREGAEATVYAVPDLVSQIGRSIYDMMALPELPQLTAENVTSLTVTAGERTLTLTPAEGAWTADGRDVTDQLADLTAWLGDMHLAAVWTGGPAPGSGPVRPGQARRDPDGGIHPRRGRPQPYPDGGRSTGRRLLRHRFR